jgi:hypothetical protein
VSIRQLAAAALALGSWPFCDTSSNRQMIDEICHLRGDRERRRIGERPG